MLTTLDVDRPIVPLQVGMNQLHGTGTPLGDPIEVGAAMAVLAARTGDDAASPSLTLAAAKSWLGHSEPAAGAVGIAHLCLAFARQAALPIMHLRSINPHLRDMLVPNSALPRSAFIPRQAAGMQQSSQRSSAASGLVAGVSAFAFQGTNAHVILQAHPASHDASQTAVTSSSLLLRQQQHWVAPPVHAMLVHAGVQSGKITFQADVTSPGCAYLLDHVVSEQPLLPATAFFELACASVHLSRTDSAVDVALMDATLAMPMQLGTPLEANTDPSSGIVTVQLGHSLVTFFSQRNNQRRHHMFASWGLLQSQHVPSAAASNPQLSSSAFFRLLDTLSKPQHAVAQASAMATVAQPASTDGLALHPAAADSMLHLASAFGKSPEPPLLRVPAALGAMQVGSQQGTHTLTWACATAAQLSQPAAHTHSFRLAAADGSAQATLQGLQLKPLQASLLTPATAAEEVATAAVSGADCLYEVAWLADVTNSTHSTHSTHSSGHSHGLESTSAHKTVISQAAAVMQTLQQSAAGSKQAGPAHLSGHMLPLVGRYSPAVASTAAIASLMRSAARELASKHCHSVISHPNTAEAPQTRYPSDAARGLLPAFGDVALQARVQHSPRLVRSAAASTAKPFQLVPKPRGALQNLTAEAIGTELAPDEVLLRVHAVGVNFRDVLNVLGMYPGDPGAPGADCAGVVVAVGSAVQELRTGQLMHLMHILSHCFVSRVGFFTVRASDLHAHMYKACCNNCSSC